MPRIPLVELEHASPEVRALYDSFSGDDLPVLNVKNALWTIGDTHE